MEMRERSLDCTLTSGGAVFNGFALEIFEAGAGFEAFDFFVCFGFGTTGASSDSESARGSFTAIPWTKMWVIRPSRLANGPMTLGSASRVPSTLGAEGPGLKSNPNFFLFSFADCWAN